LTWTIPERAFPQDIPQTTSHPTGALIAWLPTDEGGAMTINSPESMPDDEPQETAGNGATEKKKHDGGIPAGDKGVGLGATNEPNTFEPEEDPEAD
jgi:hypothetical protein